MLKSVVSRVKVIDTVGFLSFFKSYTRTTIKIPLKIQKCVSYKYIKNHIAMTKSLDGGVFEV